METKLTLKLDQSVIQSVKQYAEKNNRSLSKLVEDYFRNLISENEPQKHFTPLVEELSGVISESDIKNLDYVSYLEQKYE
jgi:Ribbon-helix-helix protein, copG family.